MYCLSNINVQMLMFDRNRNIISHRKKITQPLIQVGEIDNDCGAVRVQVAFQQADYVAWNLWASINGRPLLPFKYQHLGDMMSLGRARGAVTLPLPLAPPLRQALDGGLVGSLLSVAGIKCGHHPHPLPPMLCECRMLPMSWAMLISREALHLTMGESHVKHFI